MLKISKKNIKHVRDVQMYLAITVKKICDKNNIDYFLTGGSFLGAIQNNGFIEGDKDIDIGMTRSNYDKFLEIIQKNLPNDIGYINNDKNCLFPFLYTKLFLKESHFFNNEHEDYGIFIDICPYDNSFSNSFLRFTKYNTYKILKWFLISKKYRYVKGIKKNLIKVMSNLLSEKLLIKLSYKLLKFGSKGNVLQNFVCGSKNDWFFSKEIKSCQLSKFNNNLFYLPNGQRYLNTNYKNWKDFHIIRNDIYNYYFEIEREEKWK